MRTLKRALASSIADDGRDWDTHLQAVAFAHSSTPHTTTAHSPYFLVQAEKLSYPYSDAGMLRRWAPPSKRWLERLCAARVQANQEHMQAANERKRLLSEPGAILPGGTVVAIKLTPAESQAIYRKLAPRCSGPWTVTRVLENGTTYCVQDPVTHQGKHVSRERVKVFGLHGASADPAGGTFPRWIGPDERRSNNLSSTRLDDQSHAMDEVTEPAPWAEPLLEGLSWTMPRRARAEPGGAFCELAEDVDLEQEADDMVQRIGLRLDRKGSRHGVAKYGKLLMRGMPRMAARSHREPRAL
ncbi:hypothetical protein Efla_003583 [Eimeria flavescens]